MVDCQKIQEFDTVMQLHVNFKRTQNMRPRPAKLAMSLPSKVMGAVDKAMGDVVVGDEVDPMPTHRSLLLKKRLAR
jgi:hypothetical protein